MMTFNGIIKEYLSEWMHLIISFFDTILKWNDKKCNEINGIIIFAHNRVFCCRIKTESGKMCTASSGGKPYEDYDLSVKTTKMREFKRYHCFQHNIKGSLWAVFLLQKICKILTSFSMTLTPLLRAYHFCHVIANDAVNKRRRKIFQRKSFTCSQSIHVYSWL